MPDEFKDQGEINLSYINTFTNGVRLPTRKHGKLPGLGEPTPIVQNEYDLVVIEGPCIFIAAEISKLGGAEDNTTVMLEIDGKNVVHFRMYLGVEMGLTVNNPYGIALFNGPHDVTTMTIGFSTPLYCGDLLSLRVNVEEDNVQRIVSNIIFGTRPGGPGEETGGAPPPPPWPPT